MPARDNHRLISSGADRPRSRAQRGTIAWRLRIAIAVLSLIGIGIGGYLTYVHYGDLRVLCVSSGGCETVQSSRYPNLAGVPVAAVGLAAYTSILITVLFRGDAARNAGFGLALVGFLFSMYLTYREIFTIKAICQWCLGSAVLMTLLAILTTIRVLRVEPEAGESQPGPRPSRQWGVRLQNR